MAERIQSAGGRLEITSQPYQGTQVVLRLPE
jgi:signal transduction histidine kinase